MPPKKASPKQPNPFDAHPPPEIIAAFPCTHGSVFYVCVHCKDEQAAVDMFLI